MMNEIHPAKPQGGQLNSLVLLRGIAVIMVCFCHFGDALSDGHALAGLFKSFDYYGKYGVHMFFIISGFVIPYSLFKGRYQLGDYPRFLGKRFLRLHPPYVAALAFTLFVMYFSYRARQMPFPEDVVSILQSLVYFHIPADNPVFWTLVAEAQYYIFIGLFYVLLIRNTVLAYFIAMPVILLSGSYLAEPLFMLQPFFVFFFIGNAGFMVYLKDGKRTVSLIALLGLLVYTALAHEPEAFLFSLFTIAFILLFKGRLPRVFAFIGMISYSIYLIHFPFGIKLINLVKAKVDPAYSWLIFMVTMVLTLLVSWGFYRVFEVFSERLSKSVKYRSAGKQLPEARMGRRAVAGS